MPDENSPYVAVERQLALLRLRVQGIREGREARRQAGQYEAVPGVPELFSRKDVLVTGGSGFLGRVLVEKLLRSCPDVGTVFLLLRPKRGVEARERVQAIVDVPLFDQLRREQPGALAKLVAVPGDCAELGLGLGAEDRALLQDRVAVVFHGAASVRFDDPVRKAVLLNTRGCRELVDLCSGMRRLEALVHISTAYTNFNQDPIQERLYPTHIDWRQAIQSAEDSAIAEALDNLGPKILGFHPNTYTFSKALGEQVMGEAASFLPVVITRPAIVVGALEEPLPGWLDNLNSPASLTMAAAKGVMRVTPMFSSEVNMDYVAVDTVAKAIILAAWAEATKQDLSLDPCSKAPVINISASDLKLYSNALLYDLLHGRARKEVPFTTAIRYPSLYHFSSRFYYRVFAFFYHFLFGLAVDFMLKLANQKPMLMKVYRKIEVANVALAQFSRSFNCDTRNMWRLQDLMHPNDETAFEYGLERCETSAPLEQLKGIMVYTLNETLDVEKGLRHLRRLFWMEILYYVFLAVALIYLVRPFPYLWS